MKRWLLTSLTILSLCAVAYSAPVQLRNVPNVTTFNDVLVVDSSDVKKATNAVARSVLFSNSTTLTSFGAGPTYKGQPIGSVFANATTLRKIGAGGSGGIAVADVVASGPWVDVRAFANLSTAAVDPSTANKNIWVTTDQTTNNLTMPSNRRLVYKGGIVTVNSGKTLNMNGTIPDAGDVQIFAGSGSVTNLPFAYGRWFGATGDGSTDDTAALNKVVTAARKIEIIGGTYMINPTIGSGALRGVVVPADTHIALNPDATLKVIPHSSPGTSSNPVTAVTINGSNTIIEGGSMVGDRELHTYTGAPGATHELNFLINIVNTTEDISDITIKGMYLLDSTGDAIQITGQNSGGVYHYPSRVRVDNCTLEASRRNNISVVVGRDITVSKSTIIGAGITKYGKDGTAPKTGIDIEGGSNPWRVKILGCTFRENASAAINVFNGNEVVVSDNISDGGFLYQFASNVEFSNNLFKNYANTTGYAIYQDANAVSASGSGAMLAIGSKYKINSRATLDFTTVGSADNTVGTIFIATGYGPLGTGDSVTRQLENISMVGNTIIGFGGGIQATGITRKVSMKSNFLRGQVITGLYYNTDTDGIAGGVDMIDNALYDQSIAIRAANTNAYIKNNIADGTSNRCIYTLGTSGGEIKGNSCLNHTHTVNAAVDIVGGTWSVVDTYIKAGTTGPPNYAISNNVAGTNIINPVIDGGTFGSGTIRLLQQTNIVGAKLLKVLAPYGIYATTANASSSIISRCYLDMTSTTGNRYGIFFSGGGTGVEISNNEIRNSASTMTNSINTDANTTSRVVRNLTFSGAILSDATDTAAENLSY